MLYSERFANQWDSFVSSFQSEMKTLPAEAVTLERVSEWYKNNSFRWSSIVEKEGILLEDEKNEELKRELLDKIAGYSFEEVSMDQKPKPWASLLIGLVGAVAAGFVLKKFWHVSTWIVVVPAVVILIAAAIQYADALDRYAKEQNQKIYMEYAHQMDNYKDVLVELCRRYEK
ncbi:MAG: hypothetical protein IJ711_10915 [Lachnospiraceae bacterium]|nr:hypothetical protein [Lachnospiraceae bacterium]